MKVIGTLRDSSETHIAAESVGRALRHMSDGPARKSIPPRHAPEVRWTADA